MSVAVEYVETPFPMKHMGKNVHPFKGYVQLYLCQTSLFVLCQHVDGAWTRHVIS